MKIELLKEDKVDISDEISENEKEIKKIISIVENHASLVDSDKLKTHVKELTSVTKLLAVLNVRMEIAEKRIKVASNTTEKTCLDRKIAKLTSQIQEAEKLKEFRCRRGDLICR